MLLMQMILQGVWFDQCALINVPNFDAEIIKKIGVTYLCELVEMH
jgi:hypothetical protein